jgi:hypothetical protein
MSRFSALFKAPKRPNDAASPAEAAADSRSGDSPPNESQKHELEDNVFNLLPPENAPAASQETLQDTRSVADEPPDKPDHRPPEKSSRNVHPLATADLSRLSIDNDGRLYWDGKPVEVRRRIQMSRAQAVGASIVSAFIVIGAIGAAVQGSLALRDWGCRMGWTTSYCSIPAAPPRRPDIPA